MVGATLVPQWGKLWLSVILRSNGYWYHSNLRVLHNGCMDLLETELSFAGKFWCLTRMVYLPMAYLYGKKFVGPITPTIIDIREEIYAMSYEKIDWSEARTACAKVFNIPFSFYNFSLHYEDLLCPHTLLQNTIWTSLYEYVEPLLSSWPINKLRERALDNLMEHIHYEDLNTQYVLNMLCCWVEDPNSDAFRRHLARIPDFLWLSEDGMKAQVQLIILLSSTSLVAPSARMINILVLLLVH
ncbi:hypothetical protein HU200_009036 [Digitaria exilis]|uniref:Cycloartenol synthase n=1 Tax=Digitaria exilis TaxID=1010633 RepID=A0A835KR61_9POAL|nr:hypothetical protein HU200_009036 [Digitaria exilis]